jgi:hypothetical protein
MTASQKRTLAAKNVELIDSDKPRLKCNKCGQIWSPNLRPGGKLPHRYWQCPNGCNQT